MKIIETSWNSETTYLGTATRYYRFGIRKVNGVFSEDTEIKRMTKKAIYMGNYIV